MSYVVLFFAILTLLAGGVIVVRPQAIYGLIGKYADAAGLQVLAVIIRLILGVALIASASASKFPLVLQMLGWLTLVAALVMGCIGRRRFAALINWAVSLKPVYHHLGGIVAVLFGVFLVYAVI